MTTLSMMRGPQALCLDLLEHPETVERWTRRLGEMHLAIMAGYRAARAVLGRREDGNWSGLWAPGDMDALQCDFSTMLSPELFIRFALPELERQAAFLDYAFWHLDGTDEIRHLDAILSVSQIRAIQWVDERGRSPLEFAELFRRIRRTGRSVLVFGLTSIDEAVNLAQAVGKDGLAMRIAGLRTQRDYDEAARCLAAV